MIFVGSCKVQKYLVEKSLLVDFDHSSVFFVGYYYIIVDFDERSLVF